jgi:UDP-N-acetylmuramate-alanine ligase
MDEVEEYVGSELQAGDLLITMGAGDIWKLGISLAGKIPLAIPGV